jgi:hypothetical protein
MPPTRKDSGADDNLMLIIGQLLEATKAASEGLKSISQEVRTNAEAVIGSVRAIDALEKSVLQISSLVHDSANPHNLMLTTHDHGVVLGELRTAVKTLDETAKKLRTDLDAMGLDHKTHKTERRVTWRFVWNVTLVVAWAVTTGIALYAAITQAK